MKKNHLFTYILFVLAAAFPVLYICCLIFLPGYTVCFESLKICAAVQNIIMLGVCIAMLISKERRIGRPAGILLSISLVLLPVSRYLMTVVLENSHIISHLWDALIYLALIIVMFITVIIYSKAEWPRIAAIVLFGILFVYSGFYGAVSWAFSYEKIRDVADIASPDGIHSVRVIEYADDDNRSWLYKAVYSYNSMESFSIGSVEFLKDWSYLNDYAEDSVYALDENTQISWTDNGEIMIQDKTYSFDGEQVTEPPETPL